MIDKPEEGKKPTPKKATKKKEKPQAEEIERTPAIIGRTHPDLPPQPEKVEAKPDETPKPIAYKQEDANLVLKPEEVVSTEEANKILAEKEAEITTPKTLDEQLLDIYNAAEPGNMSLGQIMVSTGVEDPILIKQAWDRLYDLRKVPFSKLFKPGKGYIGIE